MKKNKKVFKIILINIIVVFTILFIILKKYYNSYSNKNPDISNIKLEINLNRFDKDLFESKNNNKDKIYLLLKKNQIFAKHFLGIYDLKKNRCNYK